MSLNLAVPATLRPGTPAVPGRFGLICVLTRRSEIESEACLNKPFENCSEEAS
jgi:hypothetical protein